MTPADQTIPSCDLKLFDDGGIYRWRSTFLALSTGWSNEVLPLLGIPAEAAPAIVDIARELVLEVDGIDERQLGRDEVEGFDLFHQESEECVRSALTRLVDKVGAQAAQMICELGTATDTGIEFIWDTLLWRIARSVRKGDTASLALIPPRRLDQLAELVERHLSTSFNDLEALDATDDSEWTKTYFRGKHATDREDAVNQAAELIRWSSVRSLLVELLSTWSGAEVDALLRVGRPLAVEFGVDPELVRIPEGIDKERIDPEGRSGPS